MYPILENDPKGTFSYFIFTFEQGQTDGRKKRGTQVAIIFILATTWPWIKINRF